ncbi:MAG TPA: tRNA glutamyl-Q(34) synthetase GluQRS [Steroidobacteraceae bacterium]|nr:tRNA glutamyl-Q(34) synthetase GluQRS [Steroidobacteraceae bacterium]
MCDGAPPAYAGRFAPSPTGSLHLGSLLAAIGSYLDARCRGGRWLVRMEDLDRARVVPGSADEILRTLEAFGLLWDDEVEYQSRREHLYAEALESLRAAGRTFECSCSRREVSAGAEDSGYPGTCREGPRRPGTTATRFRIEETQTVVFDDRFQGPVAIAMDKLGDVIVRRRDGVFAYQLAVVVDDALQGITDVVRGADLLESTGWQIALQGALRLPNPRHAHLPLLLERTSTSTGTSTGTGTGTGTGEKLSKSRRSAALDADRAGAQVLGVLRLLGLSPPADLTGAPPATLLEWATGCWGRQPPRLSRKLILPPGPLPGAG